jgi:hypothetical protein
VEGVGKPECGLARNQLHNMVGVIANVLDQLMKLRDAIRSFVRSMEVTLSGPGSRSAQKVVEMEPGQGIEPVIAPLHNTGGQNAPYLAPM